MWSLVIFWRLDMQISSQFLFVLWIFTLFNNVNGVPSDATVMKARCYANCLTQNAAANDTGMTCQTPSCQRCLIPCGISFSDEKTCKQNCNNVSSCVKSCEFLTVLKNFPSILNGDGSKPPTPGIPTVINKTFTSISLKWDSVQNTSGSAVYLIEIAFTGERSRFSPSYSTEVFVSPQATLKFEHPCAYSKTSPFRSEFTDIFYKFKVAILTENSSVSYGPQTAQITLSKPDPVTNVTLDSLVYDGANPGDKIKLTVSWIPSKVQRNLISKYGILWTASADCGIGFIPRTKETTGPETSLSFHIYQESMKCIQTVEIYSIIGCSVSDGTELSYTYPGCQNVTDFPASECYKFDPPYAPIEDRMVSNVTREGPMTAQNDYRFQVTMTWNPPVYPYKKVESYIVTWSKESSKARSGFEFSGFTQTFVNSCTIQDLLPETTYQLQIRPLFYDGKPSSDLTTALITTPAWNIDEISSEESDNQNSSLQPINE